MCVRISGEAVLFNFEDAKFIALTMMLEPIVLSEHATGFAHSVGSASHITIKHLNSLNTFKFGQYVKLESAQGEEEISMKDKIINFDIKLQFVGNYILYDKI